MGTRVELFLHGCRIYIAASLQKESYLVIGHHQAPDSCTRSHYMPPTAGEHRIRRNSRREATGHSAHEVAFELLLSTKPRVQ